MASKTTPRMRKKKRISASMSAHTTIPSIAHSIKPTTNPLHTSSPSVGSTECPSATKNPKPNRKPLTILESRLWHRGPANINQTALPSQIDQYTKHDSMCTACVQDIYKQNIIKVKTTRTTKPFKLVHSDVCGPFSMPTSAGHRYYVLFIHNYTLYIPVWVFQDKKSKSCSSAYKSFRARVDSMGYEVKLFLGDNACTE